MHKQETEELPDNYTMDPWTHETNQQPQEPYHLKGVGYFDINPTPPWTQPVKRFSVDETLLTHAAPAGYPPLPEVQLRQLPAYLKGVKWAHLPDNIVYWYCLKYRVGYGKSGKLGTGSGTPWPFIHYILGVSLIGYFFARRERHHTATPRSEF
jgi:hypothetical protein